MLPGLQGSLGPDPWPHEASGLGDLPVELLAELVHPGQRLHHLALLLQLQVLPVEVRG